MKIFTALLFILVLLQGHSAQANDSAAAIGAGGIQFHKTKGLVMEKEDLFISKDLVKILYVFKNVTDKDITVNIFFPLPPQTEANSPTMWDQELLAEMKKQKASYPFEKVPFENFSVVVDGQKIPFKTEMRALQNGKDVTRLFHEHKLPFSPIVATCDYQIQGKEDQTACEERVKRYKTLGLLSPEGKALWQKQVHYHWSQTFPKGKEVTIEHSYHPGQGFFFLVTDPKRPPMEVLVDQAISRGHWLQQFCLWNSRGKDSFIPWLVHEFQQSKKSEKSGLIMFYEVDYILTTGANWEGPIRDFTLTIEYPEGGTFAACLPHGQDKLQEAGKNRLQFHQKDFKPREDLKILFGTPYTAS